MISHLHLRNFRSFYDTKLSFTNSRTILHGPNGIGKTNLLESIYYICTAKSFRATDLDLIHYGETWFTVEARNDQTVEMRLQNQTSRKKQLRINGATKPLRNVLGLQPVVLFHPGDTHLFIGASEPRRNLLDTILAQAHRDYAVALTRYRKALSQRNALLRNYKRGLMHGHISDQLFVWDLQLIEPAQQLISQRRELLAQIQSSLENNYGAIAATTPKINLTYRHTADADLATALEQARAQDLASGHTTVGPHRDDFSITIDNYAVSATASRGETRTLLLALKQTELHYLEQQLGRPPILLLDDVFSELDANRRQYLLTNLANYQSIITTTEVDKKLKTKAQYIAVAELAHES